MRIRGVRRDNVAHGAAVGELLRVAVAGKIEQQAVVGMVPMGLDECVKGRIQLMSVFGVHDGGHDNGNDEACANILDSWRP